MTCSADSLFAFPKLQRLGVSQALVLIHRDVVSSTESARQILVAALRLVVHHDGLDTAVNGVYARTCLLKAFLILIFAGDEPLVGEAVRDAEGLVSPARERGFCKIRFKVNAADAEKIVHRPAVVVKRMRERAGKRAAGSVAVPALRRAADFYIHHRHRKLKQQRRITVPVVDAGPMRCLRGNMILVKTERSTVAVKRQQEISHIPRIRSAEIAGSHVAEGVNGQHIVRRIKTEKKNKDFVLKRAILPPSQGEGKTLRSSRRELQAGPWRPWQHLDLARSGSHPPLTLPPPLPYRYSCLHATICSSPNFPGSQVLVLAPVWKQSLEYA